MSDEHNEEIGGACNRFDVGTLSVSWRVGSGESGAFVDMRNNAGYLSDLSMRGGMMSTQPSLFTQKVIGMFLAAQKRPSMLAMARRVADEIATHKSVVGADDVQWELLGRGIDTSEVLKNAAGSIFKDGTWEPAGYRQSTWDPSHGRIIRVWRKK